MAPFKVVCSSSSPLENRDRPVNSKSQTGAELELPHRSRACDVAEGQRRRDVGRYRRIRLIIINHVEDVRSLHAEAKLEALVEPDVARESEIDGFVTGTRQEVAGRI